MLAGNHLGMWIKLAINFFKETNLSQYALLAIITLLAAAFRFYKLGEWSFWIDEIFSINRATIHYGSVGSILLNIPPSTYWVPISILFTSASLHALGITEWSARLAPALIGIVSIPILYFPIKNIFDKWTALIAVSLLAVSPWHIFWSQNARFYTSIMLIYTLALFMFYLGFEKDRARYIAFGFLLFYLAMSERIIALFLVPVVVSYLVILWLIPSIRPKGFNRKNLLIISIPVVLGLFVFVISYLFTGSVPFISDFDWFFLYVNYTPGRLVGTISFNIGVTLMAIAGFGGLFLLLQKSRAGILLILSAVIPIVILLPLSLFMFTEDRYAFITLPSWIVLAAVSVRGLWPKGWDKRMILSIGVLAMLIANAMGDNLLYYRVNQGDRRDWKGAFTLVQERAEETDIVVAFWPEFGPYYLDREIVAWDEVTPREIMEGGNRVWFIVDSETVWGDLTKKAWIENNTELMDVLYLRTPQDQNIRIYLYDPNSGMNARPASP